MSVLGDILGRERFIEIICLINCFLSKLKNVSLCYAFLYLFSSVSCQIVPLGKT